MIGVDIDSLVLATEATTIAIVGGDNPIGCRHAEMAQVDFQLLRQLHISIGVDEFVLPVRVNLCSRVFDVLLFKKSLDSHAIHSPHFLVHRSLPRQQVLTVNRQGQSCEQQYACNILKRSFSHKQRFSSFIRLSLLRTPVFSERREKLPTEKTD